MTSVVVYSLEVCPICEIVKSELKSLGVEFVNKDMGASENISELYMNGVYTMNAPVVKITKCDLTDYFYDDAIFNKTNKDKLSEEIMELIS